MQNKHLIITYSYHFLSEAIIIFLIFLPIMRSHYEWVPYWIYLVIIIGICLFFTLLTKRKANYSAYILTAPVLIILFYWIGFQVVPSFIFPILLTWRYIDIRRDSILNREAGYLKITLLLTTVLVIFVKDIEIVVYAFLVFLILIFGYIISHLMVIEPQDRKRFDRKLWLYIVSMLSVGAFSLFLLFDFGRYALIKAWDGFTYLLIFIASKAAFFLKYVRFESTPQEQIEQSEQGGEQEKLLEELRAKHDTTWIEDNATLILWITAILAIGFVLFIAIRHFRNTFENSWGEPNDMVTYSNLDGTKQDRKSLISRMFGNRFNKPAHPVRKMVYQFERNLAKTAYTRQPYETLEDWALRIGSKMNLDVYQKVRYGGKDVTAEEMEQLKAQLSEIELRLGS